MSRFVVFFLLAMAVSACSDRPPLPVSHAPLRQVVREIPPSGIVEVMPDDTIYTIANRYRVTPRQIILSNNLPPPYKLTNINQLFVPKPRAHIVAAGDTLSHIASRYRVSVRRLIRLNDLSNPDQLYVGQSIAIPRRLDYSLLDSPQDRIQPAPAPQVSITQSPTPTPTPTPRPQPSQSGTQGQLVWDIQPRAQQESQTAAAAAPKARQATPAPRPAASSRTVSYSGSTPDFTWPVNGNIIIPFGTSARGVHNDGVNIAASAGDPVRAAQDGEVAFVGTGLRAFGSLILIKHSGGWITAYAHLDEITVKEGTKVKKGDVLGVVGQTGRVDSPQLHFEIRRAREPVNPEDLLS